MYAVKTVLVNNNNVNIKLWSANNTFYLAGFDDNNNQVSTHEYVVDVDTAEEFYENIGEPAIDLLLQTLESDLMNSPDIHYNK